jgi:uncharacterized protein (UPF0333 family)
LLLGFLFGVIMKAALVVVACVIVAYFGMGTADSGALTIKARAAAIEAAAQ